MARDIGQEHYDALAEAEHLDNLLGEIEQLQAEKKRLRGALRDLISHAGAVFANWDGSEEPVYPAAHIALASARQTLKGTEG